MIISAAHTKLALQLKINKEAGLRPIELVNLRVNDIDFDNRRIHTTTAKRGNPRVLTIQRDTLTLLKTHIQIKNLKRHNRLFSETANYYSKKFRDARNKLVDKLNDLTIKQIRLYDLRHFFATM
jgi:integrase